MQLRMVAPLDIGLEQTDFQLGVGQDDVFDLDNVERGLKKRVDVVRLADGEMGDDASSDDEPGDQEGGSGDEEVLDSDDERERKVKGLEDELDGLYDAYRTKLAERDAKFRVQESRRKNTMRDQEWGGVGAAGVDADQSDKEEESEGEGGYDNVARQKAVGDDASSSSDEDEAAPTPRKRRKLANGKGLITSLDNQPKPTSSKAAQVWFSQDLFAGVPNVEDIGDEDEAEDEDDDDVPATSGSEDVVLEEVCIPALSVSIVFTDVQNEAGSDDDEYEIVPQEVDDNVEMWDVEDEDEDAAKQKKILGDRRLTLAVACAHRVWQMLAS